MPSVEPQKQQTTVATPFPSSSGSSHRGQWQWKYLLLTSQNDVNSITVIGLNEDEVALCQLLLPPCSGLIEINVTDGDLVTSLYDFRSSEMKLAMNE